MKYSHFTNWEASKIDLEKIYSTGSWNESNYWKQKKVNTNLLNSSNILNKLDEFLKKLPFKDNPDISFLSDVLNKSKYYAELLKEYIFEEVRQIEFPHRPSRKQCLFLMPIEVNPILYGKQMGFDMKTKDVVEIEPCEVKMLHFADVRLLNCNSASHDEKVNTAIEYWKGTSKIDYHTEILYEGNFKIFI